MTNWKTSAFGILAAIAAYVVANPAQFSKWPWVGTVAGILVAIGVGGVGLAAKDSTTHSTEAQVTTATVQAIKQSQP